MSIGRNNKLAGQIGEHLVCAELGKRGLIATPFSGNVPTFDLVVADEQCRTLPIQVKASRADNWPNDARDWMDISFDQKTKKQKYMAARKIENPDLVHIFVKIAEPDAPTKRDRFFILVKTQLQEICIRHYSNWMGGIGWIRPRSPESYDLRFSTFDLEKFENNWELVVNRLAVADKTSKEASIVT
jgi:hypothetical protein